jgi:prophage regulatory protein
MADMDRGFPPQGRKNGESFTRESPIRESQDRFIRIKEVTWITGLARSTIYDRIRDKQFPRPHQLGSLQTVAWSLQEVNEWMDKIKEASRLNSGSDRI